jgi:formylglycine-generating enzyme required for sulfatase activity
LILISRSIGLLLIAILLVLTACSGAASSLTSTPAPTAVPTVSANADWQPVTQDFDGMTMVLVPPGCFMMGNEEGRRDERPAHEVCFDAPFWIGQTEVTNAQYGSNGNGQNPNQPRENLTWMEARDFCASRGMRLPTEAEWEYAGRGPDGLIYPWGNDLIDNNLVFDRNSPGQTADVGSRPEGASWVGALDMAGNVWEWVSSRYDRYPYTTDDGREDLSDTTAQRVYRGGMNSYIDFGAGMTTRFRYPPETRDWFIGFRCVRGVG